ncbi:MAG: LLM class flavin-dependent oxidoreductase [Betaproteobacteria bacterium]|nr:LLM class flavin-dependent oxidoreductase [Betaproteobacteria bacterium]
MKFSVCLSTGFEGVMYPIPFASAEQFVEQALLCERLGYDSVWGNDHVTTQHYVKELFPDRPPNFYEPLITLAAIAGATKTIKLGTALLVLPMREPVYLAKQILTLDHMSNGRFILGVGIGAYREEFAAWGGKRVEGARRGDIMEEGLAALKLLLEQPKASYDGRHVSFKDMEMFPKARRQPFPLWVGGHNIEAVERAARVGEGWLPGWRPWNELAERIQLLRLRAGEHGRDPKQVEVAPQFSVTLGKTPEAAEQRYMASGLVAHRKSLAYTGRDLGQQVTANLVGSPAMVIDKVGKLAEIGVQHCCALMFPADSVQEMNEQIQWFAEDVMGKVSG